MHASLAAAVLVLALCPALGEDVWVYANEPFNGHLDTLSKRDAHENVYASIEQAVEATRAKLSQQRRRQENAPIVFHLMSGLHRMEPFTVLTGNSTRAEDTSRNMRWSIGERHSFVVDAPFASVPLVEFVGVSPVTTAISSAGAFFQHDEFDDVNVPVFLAKDSAKLRVDNVTVVAELFAGTLHINATVLVPRQGAFFVHAVGINTEVTLAHVNVTVPPARWHLAGFRAGPFGVLGDGAHLEIGDSHLDHVGLVVLNGAHTDLAVRDTAYHALAQPLMRDSVNAFEYSVLLDGVHVDSARTMSWRVFNTHYEKKSHELADVHVRNSVIHCRRDTDVPRQLPNPCGKVSSLDVATTRFCLDPEQFDHALGVISYIEGTSRPPVPIDWKDAYYARDSPECQDA